jgi:hypothetical protein
MANNAVINQIDVARGFKNISMEVRDFGDLNKNPALQLKQFVKLFECWELYQLPTPRIPAVIYFFGTVLPYKNWRTSKFYQLAFHGSDHSIERTVGVGVTPRLPQFSFHPKTECYGITRQKKQMLREVIIISTKAQQFVLESVESVDVPVVLIVQIFVECPFKRRQELKCSTKRDFPFLKQIITTTIVLNVTPVMFFLVQ